MMQALIWQVNTNLTYFLYLNNAIDVSRVVTTSKVTAITGMMIVVKSETKQKINRKNYSNKMY